MRVLMQKDVTNNLKRDTRLRCLLFSWIAFNNALHYTSHKDAQKNSIENVAYRTVLLVFFQLAIKYYLKSSPYRFEP